MESDEIFSDFLSHELACTADNPPPLETRARIEVIVKHFLRSLVATKPSISAMALTCRTAKNTLRRGGFFGETASIFLSHATFDRKFTNVDESKSFLRVWKVLEICYQLLGLGKRATQREIFYRLLSDTPFACDSQTQVNDAIQDAVALLKCSRHSLGILASSRGAVVGRLLIQEPNGEIIDCTKLGDDGQFISGDISYLEKLAFQSDARYILVVEKDAIFQRLAEDRFFQTVPSIIITGKGFPDLATRILLHRLHKTFRDLPILALVDWNPSGLAIICTYKFGSMRMGLEAPSYVCDVKWLGLRSEDLQYVSRECLLNLKGRDRIVGKSLLASKMIKSHDKYRNELNKMLDMEKRFEIEALYGNGYPFLSKFITQKIVQNDCI